ncbi:MAG: hypothetical protein HKN87_11970 [Saprospiraceae bacterium]|nr:hypothetical protein [Saprospiraceae bacterium]
MRCLTRHLLLWLLLLDLSAQAQQSQPSFPPDALTFRNVGPVRGGRVTTVTGHPSRPHQFYMGSAGGGVWRSNNYGISWENISDSYFETGSTGDICIAPSNPDIIYVGTGSDGLRSNVILGKGVYRTEDTGKTWRHLGLSDAGQIGAVLVHPNDPNTVLVAAIGNPFKSNSERGIYISTDGGKSWKQNLFISDQTGAVDLEFAPDDPQIVYACMWEARRKPWTIISGGHEGGLFKSKDGGITWKKVSRGLPTGLIGKSDLAVSPAEPNKVWALVEAPAPEGGVYLSEDRGASFRQVSDKRELLDRPFYFCNIDVNPQNANSIYVGSTKLWHSSDAGQSWRSKTTPHADHHGLWINPSDTTIRILANDGGATITRDAGNHWSNMNNQPTAELYQVAVDDQYPYWLYAGQQDHTTIAIPSLPPTANTHMLWEAVGGCETGPAVPKPGDPNIIYANCKGKFGVYNRKTGQEKQYYVGASNMYGHNPRDLTFRFQRVSPILVSPHDHQVIYHCSQYVHRTADEGQTWTVISPDLTANAPEKQQISGGPITRDITGEEFFSTLYAIAESELEAGVIWVGANDGPVHITRNAGKQWTNVTPKNLPAFGRVQHIELSKHDPAKAYIAVYRYLLGDFTPYIFKTTDYGATWSLLTDGRNGIPPDVPTRVVCEDPDREGLLYAGTEMGLFLSFNDGKSWSPFQQNLPPTPITDLQIHRKQLALSTMGRGFWILDDLSILHKWDPQQMKTRIFGPRKTYRHRYTASKNGQVPTYPEPGTDIFFALGKKTGMPQVLQIYDSQDNLIQSLRATNVSLERPEMDGPEELSSQSWGLYRVRWNLRHRDLISENNTRIAGPLVKPGTYRLKLKSRLKRVESEVEVMMDPRLLYNNVSTDDLIEQEELSLRLQSLRLRAENLAESIRMQLKKQWPEDRASKLTEIYRALETAKGRYQQPMLIDQLSYLSQMLDKADQRPGYDAYQQFDSLAAQLTQLEQQIDLQIATD